MKFHESQHIWQTQQHIHITHNVLAGGSVVGCPVNCESGEPFRYLELYHHCHILANRAHSGSSSHTHQHHHHQSTNKGGG